MECYYKECLTLSQLPKKDQEAWSDYEYANDYCSDEARVYDDAEGDCILKVSFSRYAGYVTGNIEERNYNVLFDIERPIGFSINDELTAKQSVIDRVRKTIEPYNQLIKDFIKQNGLYNDAEDDYFLLDRDERLEEELFTLINKSLRNIYEDLMFSLSDYNLKTCCVTLEHGERRLAVMNEYINEVAIRRVSV